MRWCLYILIKTADIRIKYGSYSQYVQYHITTNLVPLHLRKDKSSFQAVCTSKSHIYTMKALGEGSAMFFRFLMYTQWLCWWNACWASILNRPNTKNNKTTATLANSKPWNKTQKTKQNQKTKPVSMIGWIPPPPPTIQLTVTCDASDPCSALLGFLLTKKWLETTHSEHKGDLRVRIIAEHRTQ